MVNMSYNQFTKYKMSSQLIQKIFAYHSGMERRQNIANGSKYYVMVVTAGSSVCWYKLCVGNMPIYTLSPYTFLYSKKNENV